MEAKVFFSKSSNIFSVAILLAGLSTFGAGVFISETNAKDMQKQHDKMVKQEQRVDSLRELLDKEKINVKLHEKNTETQLQQIKKLEQENDKLKKEVITYKQRSESPSQRSNPIVKSVEPSQKRKVDVIATAYVSNCEGCSGVTATGINVRNKTTHNGAVIIATDPRIIPLHSKVRIDTENGKSFIAVSEDKGGAIKGNIIDVLVPSYSSAIRFGRQHVTITVLREGDGA